MMQYREQILAYAIQYKGDWYKMREAIKENKAWNLPACSCTYVTIVDPTYPCKFRRLQCPPWILFYEGNLALCEQRSVAVIGSRQPTAYGSKICAQITKILALRYCIVSGLAKGIDGIAHREALAQHTIGIMGCGLDVYYPKVNADIQQIMAKKQLVLSEYPPHTPPKPYHFPWRNRLIAALSDAVIVVEAGMRSGTMLTVNEALSLDIPIYCVPHPMDQREGKGSNTLIAQGAMILVDEQDIRMI